MADIVEKMEDLFTRYADSVAVLASQTQFVPGGELSFPSVQSVMILGCHDGAGEVTINAQSHRLGRGMLLTLPWGHAVRYRADLRDPFFVFGMHIIPWHAPDHEIELGVAHSDRHPLHGVWWRSCGGDPQHDVVVSTERARPGLAALVRYAITVFWEVPGPEESRLLGRLGCHELARSPSERQIEHGELPTRVRQLVAWVEENLDRPIRLEDLARVDGSSPTTVSRLFRLHLRTTPAQWIVKRRIGVAKTYLSSSTLTVSQVSARIGYSDAYYFSRQFKTLTGLSPRQWRARHTV